MRQLHKCDTHVSAHVYTRPREAFSRILAESRSQATHTCLGVAGIVVAYMMDNFLHNHSHDDSGHTHSHDGNTVAAASSSLQLTDLDTAKDSKPESRGHAHEHSAKEMQTRRTLAWTSVLGEVVHNFVDGALIGISFLASPRTGLTTSIAVVLHEIPQVRSVTALALARRCSADAHCARAGDGRSCCVPSCRHVAVAGRGAEPAVGADSVHRRHSGAGAVGEVPRGDEHRHYLPAALRRR